MNQRRMLTVLTCLGLALGPVAGAADSPTALLEEEVREALLRLARAGALPGDEGPVVIERPAERVTDLGLLVDRDSNDGLLVLGTTPGGNAERLGLRAGDRLLAANEVDLRGPGGSARMREVLGDLVRTDGRLELQVLRNGQEERLAGVVETVLLPALRIELETAVRTRVGTDDTAGDPPLPPDPESRCGRISIEQQTPRNRDVFPALLLSVDGRLPGPSDNTRFRLTPGRHVLLVTETIDSEQFSSIANMQRTRRGEGGYRELEIEIQPGVTYYLGAMLRRDRGNRVASGEYWEPVIWKMHPERCR